MTALPQRERTVSVKSMADVLMAVAAELERMRQICVRIERVACVLALQAGADKAVLRELQNLDLILQQAAALRDFVMAVSSASGDVDAQALEAALERITLHDVKQRLAGGLGENDEESQGDWELL